MKGKTRGSPPAVRSTTSRYTDHREYPQGETDLCDYSGGRKTKNETPGLG